jgi:hydrogenase maturation factor HypE
VPFLDGARECAREGVRTSADTSNRALIGDTLEIDPAVEDDLVALAVDPQTAGGLMIVTPADTADKLMDELRGAGQLVARVGHVAEGGGVRLAGGP